MPHRPNSGGLAMPEENGPVSGTPELSDWNFISAVMDIAG